MKRFSIRQPSWHYKRLIWWAYAKGQSISGIAERALAARIEANADQIEGMIADIAQDRGITPDELKQLWLRKARFDPSQFADDDQLSDDDQDTDE